MKSLFDRNPDPQCSSLADNVCQACEEMEVCTDIYFSRNTFVKKFYIGTNGIILIIPLPEDDLDTNEKLKQRCISSLCEICEVIELHKHIYPIFAGQERCFYVADRFTFDSVLEIDNPYEFSNSLCKFTLKHLIEPNQVPQEIEKILNFTFEDDDTEEEVSVLDSNTIERILYTVIPLERNERPFEKVRYDDEGTKYILRDDSIRLGYKNFSIDTGLVGKKKWFRVSEENPKKYAIVTTFLGFLGGHKFLHGDIASGLAYLLTFGCLGILPTVDLLLLFAGNYTYRDVSYLETEKGQERISEKVYIEKAGNFILGIGCMLICFCIGFVATKYGYASIIQLLSSLAEGLLSSVVSITR